MLVKGERIIAELLSIVGLVLYAVLLQHIWSQMEHEPEHSWINQARAWWVTRRSRARILELRKVRDKPGTVEEPPAN